MMDNQSLKLANSVPPLHVVKHGRALGCGGEVVLNKLDAAGTFLAFPIFCQCLSHSSRDLGTELLGTSLVTPIVLLFYQYTLFGTDEFNWSTTLGSNGWAATSHAFDEDHAERLFPRWEEADFGHGQEIGEDWLSLGADEEGSLQIQLLRKTFVFCNCLLWTTSDDDGTNIRELAFILTCGVQHRVQALPVCKLANEGHNSLDIVQVGLVFWADVLSKVF